MILAFPPSAGVQTANGAVVHWDLTALSAALEAGLVPLVNGDTVFDAQQGGTILSTEEAFVYLTDQLHPQRILLAGIEPGVWADYPACTHLLPRLTYPYLAQGGIQGSAAPDVTGGMAEKVALMLSLVQREPGLEAMIFSGLEPGAVTRALTGSAEGTSIGR